MKKLLFFSLSVLSFVCVSCQQEFDLQPTQPVIGSDSSATNGRLKAAIYDRSANPIDAARVYLYSSWDDMIDNLPILDVSSLSNGEADFGYVETGKYYLCAVKGYKRDTVAAQVLSQKITIRNLILR